jgi:hypothetical protein
MELVLAHSITPLIHLHEELALAHLIRLYVKPSVFLSPYKSTVKIKWVHVSKLEFRNHKLMQSSSRLFELQVIDYNTLLA